MPILAHEPFSLQRRSRLPVPGVRLFVNSLIIFCQLLLLFPSYAIAEQMVTLLTVNGERKGEIFVHRTRDGDFMLRVEDLRAAGLGEAGATTVPVEGEPHVSLRSMPGVSFTFDENTLSLNIQVDPALFPRSFIDFAGQPSRNVYYPKESSLFLNYGVQYQADEGFSFRGFSLTNELGARQGDYLFLTDTLYTKDTDLDRFVRLHTSVIRDYRESLRRMTFGDLFASSGSLGSSVNMGGIGISKIFGMDPYFITYPTLDVSGQAAVPSEVDVYVNGVKIRTERIAPGDFQLRNLSAYGGAGVVELVVRDSLGRERRYRYPYYAADNILLKKGLHDYSYNMGFLREEFGIRSNRYSKPALVAYHRYGLTDFFTLGFRGEADGDLANGGPQASFRLWIFGVLNLSLSGSLGHGTGSATDISYQYQNGRFNARLFYQQFSRSYGLIAADAYNLERRYAAGTGLGYTTPGFGSLSLDFSKEKYFGGIEKRIMSVGYSKDFPGNVTLNATFSRTRDTLSGSSNNFFVGLTYTPKMDLSFSARHESTDSREVETIQAQKNPPLGEGIGFRALVQRGHDDGLGETLGVNSMVQFNGRYGILRGEVSAAGARGRWEGGCQLNASGALVLLNGVTSLTRPVTDSFAVVKVGDIEGVMVRYGGQDIGRTDASGRAFFTGLGSYNDNLIAINDKDIPLDYYFPLVQRFVSPALRSGSCVGFTAKKMQPVTGTLMIRIDGEVKPVEFYEGEVLVAGRPVTFPTGSGGEFYIDVSQSDEYRKGMFSDGMSCASSSDDTGALLKPGTYQASVAYGGKRHAFSLTIPASTDPIIDLGQVVFDAAHDAPPGQPNPAP